MKKYFFGKAFVLLSLLAFAFSCSPTIKNFEKYQKQFLPKTSFMPNQENIEGKAPKVAVFALDENSNKVATDSKLGVSIANNVENILSQNRLAKLVDRSAVAKLQKEVALVEMNKTGSYKGPQVADYAVSGSISNADFSKTYSSEKIFFDPKSKSLINIPAKFTYTSNVSGNLKIYELPSLSVVEAIEFSGKQSRSENVKQNGGVNFAGLQIGGEQAEGVDRDDGLVRKAGEDAIQDIAVDIKNLFAKKGYILEKRSYDGKSIFKITLGSLDGIKQGDEFEVFGQYEVENPLNNRIEVERRLIAKGVVADKIDPKTSWVIIGDENSVNAIRIGDSVKMKYERSAFSKAMKVSKSIMPN